MDMAQSILGKNIEAINPDGSIVPVENETSFDCEPGHAAMALGEFHRATGLTEIDGRNIVDLTAACITAQTNDKEYTEDGLAYSSLGLLAFGPSRIETSSGKSFPKKPAKISTSACLRAATTKTTCRYSTLQRLSRDSAWASAKRTKPAS